MLRSNSSRRGCARRSLIRPPPARCLPNWSSPRWSRTFCSESVELGETDYREAKIAAEVEAVVALARKPGAVLAIALESAAQQTAAAEEESEEEQENEQLSLSATPPQIPPAPATLRVAISAEPGQALTLALDDSEIAKPLQARACGRVSIQRRCTTTNRRCTSSASMD